jgi:hypothetical protein
MIQIEHTDTFGGEANYCWASRWHTAADLTDRQAIKLAKSLAGLTGVPCRKEEYGDMIALYPRGICQAIFISYVEPGYSAGKCVDADGMEVSADDCTLASEA